MLSVLWAGQAAAVQLTPEQMKQLQGLSASEKAQLASQAGVNAPQAPSVNAVAAPVAIPPRATGNGPIEQQVGDSTADAAQQNAELGTSVGAATPVDKVAGQAGAEQLEVRRAFADFVAESKPLQVDASTLRQFGYDLFAGTPTTFAPATDVPVPPEYVLGPGDELKVQLFGQKNDTFSLTVDRDGAVAFPEIGPLTLAGMSFSDARALLAQQVRERMIGVTSSVTMGQLRSIRVFALGEVEQPGSYVVSGLATLSNALMVSGGVKKTGSLRHIQLKRQGKVVASIDLYRFLLHGDTKEDVRLLPGDVVFVPPIGMTVGIAGEVLRPAIYEVGSQSNVGDVLKLVGGLLPKAFTEKALLERIKPNGEKTVLSFPLKGKGLDTRLHNGDVVKVFSSLDFEGNPVLLIGNAKRPGKYAWSKGMHLSTLLPTKDALLPETFMDYGMIEREAKGNREPEIIRFRLGDLFLPSKLRVDVALNPRDKVYVFHRSHFRVAPKVAVAGSVKSPGEYEIKKNMRLLDLVLAAGGLTRDSMMDRAELYRTDPQSKEVSVIRFPLSAVMQGKAKDNLLLQDMDRVVVHSVWEDRYKQVVTIQGEVKRPGEYPRADNMHASDLIFAASGPTRDTLIGEAQIYRTDDKTKQVSLITFDVGKALQGDAENNPLLQDLDRVVVHSIWEVKQRYQVRAVGEVKTPGDYVLAEGLHVSDLIFAAGNVTEKAYLKQAEITRYEVVDGEKRASSYLKVDLKAALAGDKAADVELQPYDVLNVRQMTNWREAEQATISGEVRFAGTYPIEEGERLSDLLERVGGFTDKAYLRAAVFTRESIREEQQRQIDELSKRIEQDIAKQTVVVSNVKDATIAGRDQKSLEAATRVLGQLKTVKATGRLVIHLADLKHFKGSDFDIRLKNGDSLYVPQRPDQVMVLGQVYNQSAFVFQDKLDRDDYVEMSGGTTQFADEGHIYMVRASGEVDPHSGFLAEPIQPGDVIVVPEKLSQFNLVDSVLDWSRVMMQVGVGVASMKVIGIL